jgi:dolichol-phosphate mannosyltransferase
VLEYLALLTEKPSSHYISPKFVLFCFVGASGVVVHLGVLRVLLVLAGARFVGAQSVAAANAGSSGGKRCGALSRSWQYAAWAL